MRPAREGERRVENDEELACRRREGRHTQKKEAGREQWKVGDLGEENRKRLGEPLLSLNLQISLAVSAQSWQPQPSEVCASHYNARATVLHLKRALG